MTLRLESITRLLPRLLRSAIVRLECSMEIYVNLKAYNKMGGHPSVSPVGDFLRPDGTPFGDAIKEIELIFVIPSIGPPKRTLEDLFRRHQEHLASLPYIQFRRSSGKASLTVASEMITDKEWKFSRTLSLPLFRQATSETIQAFGLLRQRIKKTDSFDLEGFLDHCQAMQQRIPETQEKLVFLVEKLSEERQSRFNALSPWEKLDIDWEDYHPQARELLDDPFYWDGTDDFAPHGNDTGADLLAAYQEWIVSHKNHSGLVFWEELLKRWGYQPSDDVDSEVRWEGLIALAFAELKTQGACGAPVKKAALDCIRQKRADAESHTDWPQLAECLQRLDQMESKLRDC